VTVIVPAWNAERTIEESLRSAAEQTYRNLEILIVDDGSTDQTTSVAANFCRTEPRARLISKENGGVASARNRGILEARGDWLAPIDADDLWHPTRIEKQLAAALESPDPPGFVYCWYRVIDEDSRVVASGPRWTINGPAFRQLSYMNVVENGSALLLNREAVLEAGGYDEALRAERAQGCEDVMIQLMVARHYPVAAVPEYLVAWRRHTTNMSSDFEQIARSCRLVYRKLRSDGAPLSDRVWRWVRGISAFSLAEQYAVDRKYLAFVESLACALCLDPVRCGLLLVYRIVRSVRRRLRTVQSTQPLYLFKNVGPGDPIAADPHELVNFARVIHNLDRRRLEKLARGDADFGRR
jgi:hypothetical protein